MQLQTILNRVQRHRGFVYKKAKLVDRRDGPVVEVDIEPRLGSRAICSGCGRAGPGYDREQTARSFQFVPLWGMAVFFLYAMRRVDCRHCGVKVERVPWAEGKQQLTTTYQVFLAGWAKLLSWQQVARAFRTSWENVFRSVKTVVAWGLAHRSLEGITAIGVDEVQWQKGHKYLTIVMDLESGAVVFVGDGKGADALKPFWRSLKASRACVEAVAIDMSAAYYTAVCDNLPDAAIVFDWFHVVKLLNDKLSELRRQLFREATDQLHKDVLKGTRWLLLKRPETLDETRDESNRLQEALDLNQSLATAYYLKEDLRLLWEEPTKHAAGLFLDDWIRQADDSGIRVLQTFAKTLARHRRGLLAWYDHPISTGPLEGTNNKIKTLKRQAYGFRDHEYFALKIKALHQTRLELVG